MKWSSSDVKEKCTPDLQSYPSNPARVFRDQNINKASSDTAELVPQLVVCSFAGCFLETINSFPYLYHIQMPNKDREHCQFPGPMEQQYRI